MIRVVFWADREEVHATWLPAVPRVGDHLQLPTVDGHVRSVSWVVAEHPESPSAAVTAQVTLDAL